MPKNNLFTIAPYSDIDKWIEVSGPDQLSLRVDYDDVDQKTVRKSLKKMIKLLNLVWADKKYEGEDGEYQKLVIKTALGSHDASMRLAIRLVCPQCKAGEAVARLAEQEDCGREYWHGVRLCPATNIHTYLRKVDESANGVGLDRTGNKLNP